LYGVSFQNDWVIVFDFYTLHAPPHPLIIGGDIDAACIQGPSSSSGSGSGGMGCDVMGLTNQPVFGAAAITIFQKDMQDL
jgi:hypothetical protein